MKQVFSFAMLAAAGVSASQLNSTEIDSMVRNACNGDKMCIDMMAELDRLDSSAIGGRSTTDRANFLRRLKQLKALILHLQPAHHFARYCFYGCWCLPDAEHTVNGNGYGNPVDEVDFSCKRQSQCYECAKMDHEGRECLPDKVQYSYELNFDPADPENNMKKSITCTDDPDSGRNGGYSEKFSCRRAICECDKKLAEDLREHFHIWTMENHQTQGTFDPPTQCVKQSGNGSGAEGKPECCGAYPNRFPYKMADGARMCCGDKTYDSSIYECCDSGVSANADHWMASSSHVAATGSC